MIEHVSPIAVELLVVAMVILIVRNFQRYRGGVSSRECLDKEVGQETSSDVSVILAVSLMGIYLYSLKGIETALLTISQMFQWTRTMALGDQQHQIRGMAVSPMGAIQNRTSIPLLLTALEDDHGDARSTATGFLSRMRVKEAKGKRDCVMNKNRDHTTPVGRGKHGIIVFRQ